MATGCAAPGYHGLCHVRGDLAARTGFEQGPDKLPCEIMLPDLVDWDDGLTEDEAVAVGLWNNAGYRELLADLDIAHADLIEAAQLQNPQVNTMLPMGPKQWEFALMLPLDVLWLRPVRVAAAQLESERVAERLSQDGLDVVRDIRVAHANWQLAMRRAELAHEGYELRGEIARVAEARVAAGAAAELDVSPVRLDTLFGESEVVDAQRNEELAREQLRFVMGIGFTDIAIAHAAVPPLPATEFQVEDLVAAATASRPDLRAVDLAIAAAEDRRELARRDIWRLAGILPDINARGSRGFEAGPGLQFNVPILHQNQGAIARAEADAERLRRQYVRLRDTATLDVRRAHIQLAQARQNLKIWRERAIPQAQAAMNSAREALAEEGVSLLLVLETTRQLLAARGRELEAEAAVHRAFAELERSVGRRLSHRPPSIDMAEPLPVPHVDTGEELP